MSGNTAISQKVLVVCADEKRATQPLDTAGFQVMTASGSEDAIQMLYQHHPDAVIIHDGMAPLAGKQLHSRLREMSVVPIIMLGDKGEVERVMVIEDGADLYLRSNVSSRELAAHLHSLIKRYQKRVRGVDFDVEKKMVALGGSSTLLTGTEFRLFSCLAFNHGRVLPYNNILNEVWGREATEETVHFYVRRLKQKLGVSESGNYRLMNRRGEGYCFQANATMAAYSS